MGEQEGRLSAVEYSADRFEKAAELEAALLADPVVAEAVVLWRETTGGRSELTAYVVAEGAWAPEALRERVAARLSRFQVPWCWVRISGLPLTAEGEVDAAALAALEVVGAETIGRWEERLKGTGEVAVVVREAREEVRPLHLSEILPGWRRAAGAAGPATVTAEAPAEEEGSGRPSVSDGGPLNLEADAPRTLPEALTRAAKRSPQRGVVFLDGGVESRQSYPELLAEARRIAGGLRALGLRTGERVILQLERNQDFIPVFWGCALGGFVPAPISVAPTYAERNAAVQKLLNAWELLGRPLIVTGEALLAGVRGVSSDPAFRAESVEALRRGEPLEAAHAAEPGDLALLLLTSGSTGLPKAVQQSHAALLARSAGTAQFDGFGPEDVSLNWMPLDHVGGIVMFHLRDVYVGCEQVHAPIEPVLRRPLLWLDWIERYRATVSWAPNFAYGLVVDQAEELEGRRRDLSSMRFLLNGGEAVVARTARRFLTLLAPHGLPQTAMHPAWGMSETCSGVTSSHAFGLESTRDEDAFVEVGGPIPGISLRIVDAEDQPVPEGRTGRLQVRGATVTSGYFGQPELEREVFTADGWFKTGDLGVLREGRLTITGREKDVIIVNGVNYYSHEIEAVVEEIAGVEVSFTAACGVRLGADTDRLAVFFVPRVSGEEELRELLQEIRRQVARRSGLTPEYLVPVEPSRIPKTGIGKIQRAQLKQGLEAGEFEEVLRRVDLLLGNAQTVPDWFFRPVWRRERARGLAAAPLPGRYLLVGDGVGLAEPLRQALEAGGRDCREGLESLGRDGWWPGRVIHLGTAGPVGPVESVEELAAAQERGALSLLTLVQALAAVRPEGERLELIGVSTGAQSAVPGEPVAAERAPLLGLLKTLPAELPWLSCRHIDLEEEPAEAWAEPVLRELCLVQGPAEVAWRQGHRLIPRLEKVDVKLRPGREIPFTEGGFYLLSGGLGGVGRELAAHLLEHYQARLLLAGRSDPSTMDEEKRRALQRLERLGEVVYEPLDVADPAAVSAAVARAETRFGRPLDGVLHLAGVLGERPVLEETAASFAATLRAKVLGAWVLHRHLRPGALFVSASSADGFFGGATQGAYTAANRFLDSFAAEQRRQGIRAWTLAWSRWDEVGMSRPGPGEPSRSRGYRGISPRQGFDSLQVALLQDEPLLWIGLDAGHPFIRRHLEEPSRQVERLAVCCSGELPAETLGELLRERGGVELLPLPALPRTEAGEIDRSLLATVMPDRRRRFSERQGPRTETERRVAHLWRELLGVAEVGVEDDFFESGGHSLLATQLLARLREGLGAELPLRRLFETPTIAGLAAAVEEARGVSTAPQAPPLRPVDRTGPLPPSFAQQRLWFLHQVDGLSPVYHVFQAYALPAGLDSRALEAALREVVSRHEALRTRFPRVDGKPVQEVCPVTDLALPVVDLSGLPRPAEEAEERRLAAEAYRRPFDLAAGPLMRSILLRSATGHALLLAMHHIVSDGWSMQVLTDELATLYEAFRAGRPSPLPGLPLQYGDFAVWQREWLRGETLQREVAHWAERLAGAPVFLELPTDQPRPPRQSFRGGQRWMRLPAELSAAVERLGRREGATLFMTLLAAFQVLLGRYAGREDLLVGAPVANRDRLEVQGLIGFFVNTVVLRGDLSGDPPFRELLARTREAALDAYAHQDLPFDKLVEELRPERHLSHSPLFQTMFVLEEAPRRNGPSGFLELVRLPFESAAARFDLTLLAERSGPGEISVGAEYAADLFNAATVLRLLGHYEALLEAVAANPEARLSEIEPLTEAERGQLLREWNDRRADIPLDLTADRLVALWAARTPDAPALSFGDRRLTWRELDEACNRLARHLGRRGVGPESIVALLLDRSVELVVAILSVLRAGGAYLPLDPAYPAERLAFMLRDARPALLLSTGDLPGVLPQEDRPPTVLLDERVGEESGGPLAPVAGPENLAYVIYTSGSTGWPKGVQVTRRGLANMAERQLETFGLGPVDQVLQFSSPSFDASIFEVTLALRPGGSLCLAERAELLPGRGFLELLRRERVSAVVLPPSVLGAVPGDELPDLAAVIVAGEACPADLVSRWAPGRRFFNAYGPTETTVWATVARCAADGRQPPIGRPVGNAPAYVLDSRMTLVPTGVPGQLYVGGAGLARGYLGRPDLTAERFVPDPFGSEPGGRLYATGDLARLLPDGNLEFLGRVDHQVKIRGFRVEPGEVEAALARHPDVREAVVVARGDGRGPKRLVAYLAPREEPGPAAEELRCFLRERLPDWALPASFVTLPELPLSPNGKVDRAALPAPAAPVPDGASRVAPRSELERLIAGIWAEVLGIGEPQVHDNFFDVGGHSLLLAQVQDRLETALGRRIDILDLLQHPTVRSLAERLGSPPATEPSSLKVAAQDEERSRSAARRRDLRKHLRRLEI